MSYLSAELCLRTAHIDDLFFSVAARGGVGCNGLALSGSIFGFLLLR
jgi:hypothetical protein